VSHSQYDRQKYTSSCKSKSSPTTHLWRRRGEKKYSSYSFTTSELDGSGQRHGPAALYTLPPPHPWKGPTGPIVQETGWAPEPFRTQTLKEKCSCLCLGSNLDRPVVQSVARHYSLLTKLPRLLLTVFSETSAILYRLGKYRSDSPKPPDLF
jgi:hypothetical protein